MRFPVHVQQSKLHGYITIVSSDEENPPRYHRPGDSIEEVAQVAYDFQGIGEENLHMKNGKWYDKALGKKACQEINFVISAKLNAAEVNFECLTAARDGAKLNQDNLIPMEFDTLDMQTTDSNQGMLFG